MADLKPQYNPAGYVPATGSTLNPARYRQIRRLLAERALSLRGQTLRPIVGGWEPDFRYRMGPEPQQPQAPTAQAEQPAPGTDFRGDWDYNNPPPGAAGEPLGMQGEPLPEGATAWDNWGRPYFGDGFKGWLLGLRNSLLKPMENTAAPLIATRQGVRPERMGGGGGGATIDIGQTWENIKGGEAGTPLAYASRAVGAMTGGVLSFVGEGAKKTKQAFGVRQEQESLAEESPLPPMPDWMRFASAPLYNAFSDVRTLTSPKTFEQFDVTEWDRIFEGGLPFVKERSDLDAAWQAGRIFYSSVLDPLLKAEYMRRYQAGEHSTLLTAELENPVAEMVGELIFDPLNLLGGAARHARDVKRVDAAVDVFLLNKRVAGAIEDAASAASEAEAGEKMQAVFAAILEQTNKVKAGLADYAVKRVPWSLTSSARQFVGNRQGGEVIASVVANLHGSQQEMIDAFQAMYYLAGEDPLEIAKGLGAIRDSRVGSIIGSDAAREVGVVMRRMYANAGEIAAAEKAAKAVAEVAEELPLIGGNIPPVPAAFVPKGVQPFLDGLRKAQSKGVEGVIKYAGQVYGKAVSEIFPSVDDILKAEKAAGLAPELSQVEPWVKQLNQFHNYAQKYGYGWVNELFSGIYMGLSPAYAFRNMLSNMSHAAVDYGLGPFRHTAASYEQDMADWLGWAKKGTGFGAAKGSAGVKGGALTPFLNISEKIEQGWASRVMGHSVRQSMVKQLATLAKANADTLIKGGFTRAEADILAKALITNKGNWSKALETFRAQSKIGVIEAFRNLEWLDTAKAKQIQDFDLWDDVLRIVNDAPDGSSARAKILDLLDEEMAFADTAADDVVALPRSSEQVADGIEEVAEYARSGANDASINEFTDAFAHNEEANRLYRDVLQQARAEALAVAKADPNKLPAVQAVLDQNAALFDNSLYRAQILEIQNWRLKAKNNLTRLLNAIKNGKTSPAAAWKSLGQTSMSPTSGDFLHRFYDEYYFEAAKKLYAGLRDRMAGQIENAVEALRQAVDLPGAGQGLPLARNEMTNARWFDQFASPGSMNRLIGNAIADGDNALVARLYAKQYGVPTVAGEIGPNFDRRLLNIINRNMPPVQGKAAYNSLADVKPEDAEKALIAFQNKRSPFATVNKVRAVSEAQFPMPQGVTSAQVDERIALQAMIDSNASLVNRWLARPIDSIESGVREAMQAKAAEYVALVDAGVPGQRIFDDDTGKFKGFTKSTYPAWYGQVGAGRQPTIDALNKIITGNGLDKGSTVDKLKDLILDDLIHSDPRVMMYMGNNQAAYRLLQQELEAGEDLAAKYGTYEADRMYALLNQAEEAVTDRLPQLVAQPETVQYVPEPPPPPRPIPAYHGAMPTAPRIVHQQRAGIEALLSDVADGVKAHWGESIPASPLDRARQGALAAWEKAVGKGVAESRVIASAVANAARDFTLLSYPEKRYFDLAGGYVFPYHFWYGRTYGNWLKRITQTPEVLAGYAKYREMLSKIHAGAPEWWKWNINSNELLGLDMDNPIFVNLEATINPFYGAVNVDFNDRYKRLNWWTKTLDDLGKFGPTTWTPFSIATAIALALQGESETDPYQSEQLKEGAARWAGRLIPQTQLIKAVTGLAGVSGGLELDPSVHLFSGGLDPYERGRVGRALATLVSEGQIDEATALDAGHAQAGPAWDMAKDYAMRQRAPGNIAASLVGVGFRARSLSDIQIDKFYSDYFALIGKEPDLSPAEYRRLMDDLRTKYPFMDTLLLARKGGVTRDRTFAYNVLGRIPPGSRDDYARAGGIPPELFTKFYDEKGHIEKWPESDRERFTNAIVDMAALLDVPDAATRGEWTAASGRNSEMYSAASAIWGEDIWDKVDRYYAMKGDTPQEKAAADAFLAQYPEVSDALDWKSQVIMTDQILQPYYASIGLIEQYYNGAMYDKLYKQFPGIGDAWDGYFAAKLDGTQKAYWKAHPELQAYMDLKDAMQAQAAQQIVDFAANLPEGEDVRLRPNAPVTYGQEQVYQQAQGQMTAYDMTWQDFQPYMSDALERVVQDFAFTGEPLSNAAEDQLATMAENLGVDYPVLLELLNNAALQSGR